MPRRSLPLAHTIWMYQWPQEKLIVFPNVEVSNQSPVCPNQLAWQFLLIFLHIHPVILSSYCIICIKIQRLPLIVLRCLSCSVFMFIIWMENIICVRLIRYCLLLVTFVQIFLLNLLSTFACVYWNYKYPFYYLDW